jgi:type II secretory pathway pseudopilin PulG
MCAWLDHTHEGIPGRRADFTGPRPETGEGQRRKRIRMRGPAGHMLVDILVVMLVIGTLVNMALPNYVFMMKKIQAARVVCDLVVIRDAAALYHMENAAWPESGGTGKPPRQLGGYLPDDFAWDLQPTMDIRYAWHNCGPSGTKHDTGTLAGVSVYSGDSALLSCVMRIYKSRLVQIGTGNQLRRVILVADATP